MQWIGKLVGKGIDERKYSWTCKILNLLDESRKVGRTRWCICPVPIVYVLFLKLCVYQGFGPPSDIWMAILWTYSNYHAGLYTCPAIYPCLRRCVVSQLMEAWLGRGWDSCFTWIWSIIGINQALISLEMGSSSLNDKRRCGAVGDQKVAYKNRSVRCSGWCAEGVFSQHVFGFLDLWDILGCSSIWNTMPVHRWMHDSFWFRRPKLNSRTCRAERVKKAIVKVDHKQPESESMWKIKRKRLWFYSLWYSAASLPSGRHTPSYAIQII